MAVLKRAFAAGAVALVLLSAGSLMDRHAVVEGGIRPCSGLPVGSPHYAAGTVRVYQDSFDPYFGPPFKVQKVGVDSTYRFVLDPGRYLLEASTGAEVTVNLQPGDDVYVDIPNTCI